LPPFIAQGVLPPCPPWGVLPPKGGRGRKRLEKSILVVSQITVNDKI